MLYDPLFDEVDASADEVLFRLDQISRQLNLIQEDVDENTQYEKLLEVPVTEQTVSINILANIPFSRNSFSSFPIAAGKSERRNRNKEEIMELLIHMEI